MYLHKIINKIKNKKPAIIAADLIQSSDNLKSLDEYYFINTIFLRSENSPELSS